jgi:hypothetical protein
LAIDTDHADEVTFPEHGDTKNRAITTALDSGNEKWVTFYVTT